MPKLLYGSQVWCPNRKDLSKLEQFQKHVSKWICKGARYKTRLISSGLLPINLLLKINDLLFVNGILNGIYDFDFHNFLSITYPVTVFTTTLDLPWSPFSRLNQLVQNRPTITFSSELFPCQTGWWRSTMSTLSLSLTSSNLEWNSCSNAYLHQMNMFYSFNLSYCLIFSPYE